MAQKITVTTTRWCCEPEDLVPDQLHREGAVPLSYCAPGGLYNPWRYMVCKHCCQRFEHYSYTDAAGSAAWGYRQIPAGGR